MVNWKKERQYRERIRQIAEDVMNKPVIYIPSPYGRWDGELAGQATTTVAYETDGDRAEGTMSMFGNIRIVVREDGILLSGYNNIQWNWQYKPLEGEVMEAEGKQWQVFIDSTGRDLWVEVNEYALLVQRAREANQAEGVR
jgi:hypothetical protein